MNSTIWVIKIGGAILAKSSALTAFLVAVQQLVNDGHKIVLVHGGGITVDDMLAQANFTTKKVDGLRVTPKSQIATIVGALAGTVNKTLVANAQSIGLLSVGLSLLDGNSVNCQPADVKLEQVGLPTAGNAALLTSLLNNHFLPIICSIGALANGQLVNVNADDAAVAVSQLLNAELVLLTDVKGVNDAHGNTIEQLNFTLAEQLIADGVISGGMIAKVNAAMHAAKSLRRSIAVASWDCPAQLVQLLNGQPTGTRILPTN